MKKPAFSGSGLRYPAILLLLFLCFSSAFAQDYTPFPTENAEWHSRSLNPFLGGGSDTRYWKTYLTGDTVIDGQTYRIVRLEKFCRKKVEQHTQEITYFPPNAVNDLPVGAVREEDRRIYFYKFDYDANLHEFNYESTIQSWQSGTEYLLYDFNFSVGDTVWLEEDIYLTVEEEMTPLSGRRRYRLSHSLRPFLNTYWIEGAGSEYGLFGAYYDPFFQAGGLCIWIGGDYLFGAEGECYECSGLTSATEATPPPTVRIFPNPAADVLSLETEQGRFVAYRLFDSRGQLLRQGRIRDAFSHIDLTGLPDQLLLLVLQMPEGGLVSQKVLKSKPGR